MKRIQVLTIPVLTALVLPAAAFADGGSGGSRSDSPTTSLSANLAPGEIDLSPIKARLAAGRYRLRSTNGSQEGTSLQFDEHAHVSFFGGENDEGDGGAHFLVLDVGGSARADLVKDPATGDTRLSRIDVASPALAPVRFEARIYPDDDKKKKPYATGDVLVGAVRYEYRNNRALETSFSGATTSGVSFSGHVAGKINDLLTIDLCGKVNLFSAGVGETQSPSKSDGPGYMAIIDLDACAAVGLGPVKLWNTTNFSTGDIAGGGWTSVTNATDLRVNIKGVKAGVGYSFSRDTFDDANDKTENNRKAVTHMVNANITY